MPFSTVANSNCRTGKCRWWDVSHTGNLGYLADIVTTGISFLRFGLLILWAAVPLSLLAQSGFVKSGGQALPGATVAAVQSGQSFSTVTDGDGHYTFPPLGAGTWSAMRCSSAMWPRARFLIFAVIF